MESIIASDRSVAARHGTPTPHLQGRVVLQRNVSNELVRLKEGVRFELCRRGTRGGVCLQALGDEVDG